MSTKKILTLGLVLTLMSPIASYAKDGAESGGGGDAVMVNGQLVMRDFLNTDQTEKVKDNLAFINSVPKFREMIYKVAKANPVFANDIIGELANVSLHNSPTSLPVLPYSVTTLSGKGAEVQLATRINNDIIFAPEYYTFPQKENVLLHEALHGLLAQNSGPFHHQRVRNIVRYIHENLDSLNENDLAQVLQENYWYTYADGEKIEAQKYVWNKNNNSDLRCYFAYRYSGSDRFPGIPDSVVNFEKLNCIGRAEYPIGKHAIVRDQNIEKYMTKNYPEMVALRGTDYLDIRFAGSYVNFFTLEKDGLFTKKWEVESKKNKCRNNNDSIDEIKGLIKDYKNYLTASKMMNKVLETDGLSELEKNVIIEAMYLNNIEKEDSKTFEVKLEDVIKDKEEVLKKLLNQKVACNKQYPNL